MQIRRVSHPRGLGHNLNGKGERHPDHQRAVSIMRFSHGQIIATWNWAGGIKLLTVPNLEEKGSLTGHKDRVSGLAWFPGATLPSSISDSAVNLASGGGEGNVALWSLDGN